MSIVGPPTEGVGTPPEAEPSVETDGLVWDCGPHANVWNGHDARCRKIRPNRCARCRDCFHPSFGPSTDGDPCPWCRDCGCHQDEHSKSPGTPRPGGAD